MILEYARLPNDIPFQLGVETEVFRFPVELEPGSHLIRFSLSGSVFGSLQSTFGLIKVNDIIYYTTFNYTIFPPPLSEPEYQGIFAFTPINWIVNVDDDPRDITVSMNIINLYGPVPTGLRLCGEESSPFYAWQVTIEKLT